MVLLKVMTIILKKDIPVLLKQNELITKFIDEARDEILKVSKKKKKNHQADLMIVARVK